MNVKSRLVRTGDRQYTVQILDDETKDDEAYLFYIYISSEIIDYGFSYPAETFKCQFHSQNKELLKLLQRNLITMTNGVATRAASLKRTTILSGYVF